MNLDWPQLLQIYVSIIVSVFGILWIAFKYMKQAPLYYVNWKKCYVWFAIGMLADGITTFVYMQGASVIEMNPSLRWLFERFGVCQGLLMHGGLTALILAFTGFIWGNKQEWIRFVIVAFAYVHFVAAIHNIIVMSFF